MFRVWFQALFVDENDHVLGTSDYNLAMVTQDDVMVVPPPEAIEHGLTLQRLIKIIPEARQNKPSDLLVQCAWRIAVAIDFCCEPPDVMNIKINHHLSNETT